MFVLPIGLLLACSEGRSPISEQITAQLEASKTSPIDLSLVGPTSWDRVCVLPPYTLNQTAEQILGFPWDAQGRTAISGSDGINVLAFIQDGQVLAHAEHPRNKGDFSELQPRCLTRSQAKVSRQTRADGWVYLVAP